MPTSVSRGLPCEDAGSTLPVNAKDWQNRANADVVNLHDRAPVFLNSVTGINTVTAAAAISIPAYRKGMSFYFVPAANNTGAMTINIDGRGAVPIVNGAGNALVNADIKSGDLYTLVYDGTQMVISGSNVGQQGDTGLPVMLLDQIGDVDSNYSSNIALQEVQAESFTFTTDVDNQYVDISIYIPVVVFPAGATTSDRNGACRIYLDGTAFNTFPGGEKQWNGTIIGNAGQWCSRQNVPVDTVLVVPRIRVLIPTAGVHTIHTHVAGTTTDTVIALHSRRRYQVQTVKALKGDTGLEGMPGTSALTVVRTVATANVTIASALEGGDTLNGVTLATNDTVLLTAQTAPAENGVYVVVASGAASRHANFASYDGHCGRVFSVQSGSAKAGTFWHCTSNPGGTLGTTAITIVEAPTTGKNSVEVNAGQLQLSGDTASPGASKYYGTDGAGARGWLTPICFSANKNATDQSGIVSGTATKITFGNEEFDVGGYYDAANSKFVPPAGKYRISVVLRTNGGPVDQGAYGALLYKNGVLLKRTFDAWSGIIDATAQLSCVVDANGTDYFEAYFQGFGTGNKTISGAVTDTWFCGEAI